MMIYLVDKTSIGNVHIMYNASILKVFKEAYPNAKLFFFSEHEHQLLVERMLNEDRNEITFSSIHVLKPTGGILSKTYQFLLKLKLERKFFKSLFLQARQNKAVVFICSVPPVIFPLVANIKKDFSDVKLINSLHGELEYIYYFKNFREKQIGKLYASFISKRLPNNFYLFLNKIAADILIKKGYVENKSCISIDHPYLYNEIYSNENDLKNNQPIKLGQIGSLGMRKNGKALYDLAAICSNLIQNNVLIMRTVGPIEDDVLRYRNKLVLDDLGEDNKAYISRETFESRIKEIDYALFFFTEEQFIFRASGALFDVLQFQKPIIALSHPYFESLFLEAGNIGYLVGSIEEMKDLVEKINGDKDFYRNEYKLQIKNLVDYQKNVTIKSIANSLKLQIENKGK